MPSRYHPLDDQVWDDSKLEGLSFEAHGFFVFLFGNRRQRPSGIYRVTDSQLCADTGLAPKVVKGYLVALQARTRIVRDGAWIFVKNYFKRQPKQEYLLKGAESDVKNCDSRAILDAFAQQYPMFRQWSNDRLATIDRSPNELLSTEQSNAEQCRAEQSNRPSGDGLVTLWNTATERSRRNGLPGLIPCRVLTESRASKVRQRLAEEPDLDWWSQAIDKLAMSKFARGSPSKDGRSWRASFDWLIANDTNATKAYEGKYDDQKAV